MPMYVLKPLFRGGVEVPLTTGSNVVGRSAKCGVESDVRVSREHISLFVTSSGSVVVFTIGRNPCTVTLDSDADAILLHRGNGLELYQDGSSPSTPPVVSLLPGGEFSFALEAIEADDLFEDEDGVGADDDETTLAAEPDLASAGVATVPMDEYDELSAGAKCTTSSPSTAAASGAPLGDTGKDHGDESTVPASPTTKPDPEASDLLLVVRLSEQTPAGPRVWTMEVDGSKLSTTVTIIRDKGPAQKSKVHRSVDAALKFTKSVVQSKLNKGGELSDTQSVGVCEVLGVTVPISAMPKAAGATKASGSPSPKAASASSSPLPHPAATAELKRSPSVSSVPRPNFVCMKKGHEEWHIDAFENSTLEHAASSGDGTFLVIAHESNRGAMEYLDGKVASHMSRGFVATALENCRKCLEHWTNGEKKGRSHRPRRAAGSSSAVTSGASGAGASGAGASGAGASGGDLGSGAGVSAAFSHVAVAAQSRPSRAGRTGGSSRKRQRVLDPDEDVDGDDDGDADEADTDGVGDSSEEDNVASDEEALTTAAADNDAMASTSGPLDPSIVLSIAKTRAFVGKCFCLTGTLSMVRRQWEEIIYKHGGAAAPRVSKNVTHLVCGEQDGYGTSKHTEAVKRGIPIVEEPFLVRLLYNASKGVKGAGATHGHDAQAGANDIPDGKSVTISRAGVEYVMKNIAGVYSCSCKGWKFQSVPISSRTCKHLREYRGSQREDARIGSSKATAAAARAALPPGMPSHPPLSLPYNLPPGRNVVGWWMSEKMDGVRAYWNGKCFQSRGGNIYYAPDWFVKGFPSQHMDGELWAGRQKFSTAVSVARSAGGDRWNLLEYRVFDLPAHDGTFEERQKELKSLVSDAKMRHLVYTEQVKVTTPDHLKTELARVEGLGGEGLVVRQPGSRYEGSRSWTMLKVKTFHDAEAKVIAHESGQGKHGSRLGALKCVLPNGKQFKVGTGLSDKQRDNPPAVGTIITFRYQELTPYGIPRFPAFMRICPNTTWPPASPWPPPRPKPAPVDTAAQAGAGGAGGASGAGGGR